MRDELMKEIVKKHGKIAEEVVKDYFSQLRHELSNSPYVKIYVPNLGTFHPVLYKIERRIKEKIGMVRAYPKYPEHLEELKLLWKYRRKLQQNTKVKKKCKKHNLQNS